MTNEEIIAILENYKDYEDSRTEDLLHHGYDNTKEATKRKEALDEAIKALSENKKKGKWKKTYLDHVAMGERPSILYCSVCHQCIAYPTNYCPNCGADMRGGKE